MPRRKLIPPARIPQAASPYNEPAREPAMPKPRFRGMAMSVEDMADELAIGRNVAYQLVQDPGFPSFMIGRRVLVSRQGLQEWIREQCKKGSCSAALAELQDPSND